MDHVVMGHGSDGGPVFTEGSEPFTGNSLVDTHLSVNLSLRMALNANICRQMKQKNWPPTSDYCLVDVVKTD